jgi:hypothetical protein
LLPISTKPALPFAAVLREEIRKVEARGKVTGLRGVTSEDDVALARIRPTRRIAACRAQDGSSMPSPLTSPALSTAMPAKSSASMPRRAKPALPSPPFSGQQDRKLERGSESLGGAEHDVDLTHVRDTGHGPGLG